MENQFNCCDVKLELGMILILEVIKSGSYQCSVLIPMFVDGKKGKIL